MAARDHQQLWKDVASKADEAEAVRSLAEILADKEGRSFISLLERKDAELCVGILDHGTRECNLNSAEKNAFLVTLRRLAERHELLPDRMRMTENIVVSDEIVAFGGFGDVRPQMYKGRHVAVKTARVPVLKDLQMMRNLTDAQKKKQQEEIQKVQKIRKRFYREVVLWSTLSHPNVLKLLGVQEDVERGQFVTVAEWMERGTIMDYIESHHANRLELLYGAAQGLKYLHDANLAHGDLKGENILISNDSSPHACLADFGFITKVLDPDQKSSCSAQIEGGTMQFMSLELLVPRVYDMEGAKATPQADVYAFGLVIFQVLTGKMPFPSVQAVAMGFHILRGDRPPKPENASTIGFSDSLWDFTQNCWSGKIESRPKVGEVVTRLGEAAAQWDGLMPPCPPAENVVSYSREETLDFGGMFRSSPTNIPENATGSQANSALFSALSITSTERTEPLQGEPQAAVTKPQDPVIKPQDPVAKPEDAVTKPEDTVTKPEEAAAISHKELQPESEEPQDDPSSSQSSQLKQE